MLLVKVWVPKTHPSFEKRETVLQFFLVHKTPAAGRPPPNFRLHLTWYRRQLCSPDIFQNHRKLFCKLCKTSKKKNIKKTHYILAMEEKTHTTHKKLDLPHREEMRNFFMETVFVVKFLLDWEIPFEPYQGNMKKCIIFSVWSSWVGGGWNDSWEEEEKSIFMNSSHQRWKGTLLWTYQVGYRSTMWEFHQELSINFINFSY